MAYYITRQNAERHQNLLRRISDAVSSGSNLELAPADGQTLGAARYWIRNLLKCAEAYPELGFADLCNSVEVSIDNRNHMIVVKPRNRMASAAPSIVTIDEMGALAELMACEEQSTRIEFEPSGNFDIGSFREAVKVNGWKIIEMEDRNDTYVLSVVRIDSKEPDSSVFDVLEDKE